MSDTNPTKDASRRALTLDGRIVSIRPVRPGDAAGLTSLHDTADTRSIKLRFFALGKDTVPREVERLTRPPGDDFAALVAVDHGRIVGVASYEREPGASRGELAVFVASAHHGRGIATLLLEHLSVEAHRNGLTQLEGKVLLNNTAMLKVICGLSADGLSPAIGNVVDFTLPTSFSDRELSAVDFRGRSAQQRSLAPLMTPRTVAVVGAGRRPGGIGHEILRQILEYDFTGSVYPIHPHADTIAGQRCYKSLDEVPAAVDLVIVAVPAAAVADVIDEAGRAGARAAVVISSGFAEIGEAGVGAQAELVNRARRHDMRLVGPNCLGFINTDPRVRLAASFAVDVPEPGGLAVASQSGAVGIAVLHHARGAELGIRSFVSLGNKADVSGNDLLSYWFDDPDCRAAALYLESFGNPRRFARVARAFARQKPILAVKSGRSSGGRRAGASHTAAAAAANTTVDSLFEQSGVIRTDTLGEMIDAARLLSEQPLAAGNRIAIVGNAGGINVLAADSAETAGLTCPQLSPPLADRLRADHPAVVTTDNPIDLGAATTPAAMRDTIVTVADSGETHAMVVAFAASRSTDVPGCLQAIADAADAAPDTPMAVVLIGVTDAPATLGKRRVPVFDLPERAVAALGRAVGYAEWRRQPLGESPQLSDIDQPAARSLVDEALRTGGGWQNAEWSRGLLASYGIPHVETRFATSVHEAVAAADAIGFPVALKADDPTMVHKTERGAVHLGLDSAAAVKSAYLAIGNALHTSVPRVAVQPMVTGTVELIAGVTHDRQFGSVVMLGRGGIQTELWDDNAFRLLPLTDLDARRMWRSLRTAPLLTGYRGSQPVDTYRLEDLMLRLARLAEDFPELAELDINPLLAGPGLLAAVDVKVNVAATDTGAEWMLPTLREP
ncbi:GNAT family N-acetyltransferase [Stackebrandtia nassauensis]|uniref:CoA-binding domain protein n=1 Tax=Stackebrandtia nassauensis (strain DSM 44728 / CIP 108903 / NRRL B-16338 / NBRC 102104 / LLR-40K-21) TaxID=446470 RepID=D3PVJ8_STANL|nr:GNAT family N-acetyltransferase [Stackebrandtia nassauensis]ADD43112.1 CoA-binding domain protein [Stackebrandtia nassauensis DSM 44728]